MGLELRLLSFLQNPGLAATLGQQIAIPRTGWPQGKIFSHLLPHLLLPCTWFFLALCASLYEEKIPFCQTI